MSSPLRMSQPVQELLRCPRCQARLKQTEMQFECTAPDCATLFPIVDGIPVLINEQASVFAIADFVSNQKTFFRETGENKLAKTVQRWMPTLSANIKGAANYRRLSAELLKRNPAPRVLVIGGGILGKGMEALTDQPAIELVESDVSLGPRTGLICDAHDIPFEDGAFDGVIIQAVLEHVVDPQRCCAEIHRVLKAQGVVYAETPFMQQVHGGRYDFTRFTHLGHRRLFRWFAEIESGALCGPGMALAWAYQYFLLSFAPNRIMRALFRVFAAFTAFYLKYFDYYLIDRPGALDAASGYYFIGEKAAQALPDRELIKLYRGAGA